MKRFSEKGVSISPAAIAHDHQIGSDFNAAIRGGNRANTSVGIFILIFKLRPGVVKMIENIELELPNGKICYVTSTTMRTIVRILRWEIFKRVQYRRPGFELRVNDSIIDIGANVGMFALWAAPQIPGGELICVEPNPHALKCLAMNVRRNNLHNVLVIAAAAGSENGMMELSCRPGWEALAHRADLKDPWYLGASSMGKFARLLVEGGWLGPHCGAAAEQISVPQRLLSSIMDEHDMPMVNFLKLDCEGSEYEILGSLDSAHWSRIERAVIEYHDVGPGQDGTALADIFRKNGFEIENIRLMQERLYSAVGIRVGKIWARKPWSTRTNPGLLDVSRAQARI